MFKYLWNTTKRIASHKEGSWYDFLFYVLRCSGLAAHACIWPHSFIACLLCWWQKGWLVDVSRAVQSSRWIRLQLGCNSQPTKQTTSLCGFVQGQDYSLEKTSRAWVRQPNTIVVKTLWPGLSRVMGTVQATAWSSHQERVSFPQPQRNPCSPLGQTLEAQQLCLLFLTPTQQFLTANHICHPTRLRAYMMFPHFSPGSLVPNITVTTHISRLYVGMPQQMGTDGSKTNRRAQHPLSGILSL